MNWIRPMIEFGACAGRRRQLEEKARAAIAALIARRMLALDAITWKAFSWRAVSHARRTSDRAARQRTDCAPGASRGRKNAQATHHHFGGYRALGYGDRMIERTRTEEGIEARLGHEEAAQVRALAALMGASPVEPTVAQPPHPRPEVVIPVTRSDAKAAGGADLIQRTLSAVVSPDAPNVRAVAEEVVAALKNMGPRSAVEGGLAGLFVAAQVAAFDCYRLARRSRVRHADR